MYYTDYFHDICIVLGVISNPEVIYMGEETGTVAQW
jgi:hypothetical protein